MKFIRLAVVLGALTLAFSPRLHAQETIKSLADTCRTWDAISSSNGNIPGSPDQVASMAMKAGICIGYIEGFLAGYSTSRGAPPSATYCLPPTVSKGQIARVIVRKIEDHPELENTPQLVGIMGILMGTWPCPSP